MGSGRGRPVLPPLWPQGRQAGQRGSRRAWAAGSAPTETRRGLAAPAATCSMSVPRKVLRGLRGWTHSWSPDHQVSLLAEGTIVTCTAWGSGRGRGRGSLCAAVGRWTGETGLDFWGHAGLQPALRAPLPLRRGSHGEQRPSDRPQDSTQCGLFSRGSPKGVHSAPNRDFEHLRLTRFIAQI